MAASMVVFRQKFLKKNCLSSTFRFTGSRKKKATVTGIGLLKLENSSPVTHFLQRATPAHKGHISYSSQIVALHGD